MEQLFQKLEIKLEEIVYSFNSTNYCFFFLKNGKFLTSKWNKNYGEDKKITLQSNIHEFSSFINAKKNSKPISSRNVPNGSVIEFFDSVILIHHNERIMLENKGVTSVRTYPASIRYQNLISIFDGDGLALHSIFPI